MIGTAYRSQQEREEKFPEAREKDEMTLEINSLDVQVSCSDLEESLEGLLYVRKGRSSGHTSWSWNRLYTVFRFEHGGSLLAYKETDQMIRLLGAQESTSAVKSMKSSFHGRHRHHDFLRSSKNLEIEIASDLPWLAKDVDNDLSTFVIEIATDCEDASTDAGVSVITGDLVEAKPNGIHSELDDEFFASDDDVDDDNETRTIDFQDGDESYDGKDSVMTKQDDLLDELNNAKKKGKPLRIYFRCDGGVNEKAMWLKTFSKFDRFSNDIRKKKSLFTSFTSNIRLGAPRVRSITNDDVSTDKHDTSSTLKQATEVQIRVGRVTLKDKEFRILPTYAYPHCTLTKAEMREEMLLPSDHFHDLRVPGCNEKEIGSLEVEVLECIGLPKMDRGSDTDAVVYLVCGSYAFSTDIIFNRVNPMWLRKTRRACIFPLFHGYARLYVGVFDHERKVKDDFAGRVVIDVARLRPHSTYDVTLPLRLSTHVYSKRRRGAVRLRFTLKWTSERDALLSYIPKSLKITLPQHSKPNFETTVMCSDQKAFRNIAITVHGAHLPRRFTFNQMRAAIREINFTRKYIFTVIKKTVRETMHWKNPAISGFVFLSWMHCVFANAFSLVPFYLMLYFLLFLMRNYAKYSMDAPSQRGFIPPSWEELFFALVRGGDPNYHCIEPLELGIRHPTLSRRRSPESTVRSSADFSLSQHSVITHKPKGKKFLRALGFLPDPSSNPNDDHVEFPFADGKDYPKFTVKECLVTHGKQSALTVVAAMDRLDCASTIGSGVSDNELHRNGVISRFPLDVDLHWLMRKDCSGTKDFDEEENNFNASRAVMSQGRKAASKMTKTATALSSKTGLDYVVRPIQSGISSGVGHVSSSVGHMSSVAGTMTSHMMSIPSSRRRRSGVVHNSGNPISSGEGDRDSFDESFDDIDEVSSNESVNLSNWKRKRTPEDSARVPSILQSSRKDHDKQIHGSSIPGQVMDIGQSSSFQSVADRVDPDLVFPEQDIDIQGPSTGKKIPDDLAEIKDKMHELTWHLFDDYAYVVKNPNAVFFGEALKPEKRRKTDTSKQIDKYLHLGQYSHPNPFVARVGTYVEPIIGSSYSLLCLFRAGFNVVTWRDPMLTFWLSLGSGMFSIILWFFPWRYFLFGVGIWLVGPQNWAFRILREQGYISSNIQKESKKKMENDHDTDNLQMSQPVFSTDSRKQGNDPRRQNASSVDPREIHHIVVPYGPLMYQRCNDWPPEPEYAQVRSNISVFRASQSLNKPYEIRRHNSIVRDDQNDTSMISRLRRRLRRTGPTNSDQILPPLDPTRNRAASRD